MKNIYKVITAILFCCISKLVIGQNGTLAGKVIDEKGTAVGYANVRLIRATDTSFIGGVVSGNDGDFSIKSPAAGSYFLRVSAIGFAELKSPVFNVNDTAFVKNFGSITITSTMKKLQEVTVTSLRPSIVQLADRMVVSIEGTALAAGNTAFDVLGKAPGVFVDQEGNIQLNGRSGVTIMLDGKLTYLSARDLRNLLQSMSAENIKNIEIITNPSAKYDAEGASGILNINLKKNDRQGVNGSIYAGDIYNFQQHSYSAGGNINYKIGKWNSFMTLDFSRRTGGRDATFTRIFYTRQKTTYFDQNAIGNYSVTGPPAVRLGSDFSINNNHTVGFVAGYTTSKAQDEFLTDTWIGSATGKPALYINADNYNRNVFKNLSANVHYVGKLDTLGSSFSADIDYVKIRNRGEANFYNYYDTIGIQKPLTTDFLYTDIPNGYDIYSAKADYSHSYKKGHKLEMGAKTSRVFSDNDSRFYFNNGGLVLDPLRTNHFTYKEQIYAAYVNFNGALSKQVTLQAGLRAEHTNALGNLLTSGQVTPRKYTTLFPSVFLQQKVSENYGINYSYSRRLQRPNYGNLNPFRSYRDPYTYIEGNPYLRPQYAHSFSITQTFKKNYNLIMSYQYIQDVISELPLLDVEKSTTIYYTGNVDDGHNASITAIAPVRISKKWESQNTVVVGYNKLKMITTTGPLINEQVTYTIQSNHTIQLPLDLRMELNLLYLAPRASGLYLIGAMHRVNVGFKKSILNKKVDVSVNANDLFKGFRYKFTTDINGNVNDFDQYFRFRNIGISLRYNFSKGLKVDTKRRNNTLEELNRTGN